MKQPAKNRPCGGMGRKPRVKGSAAKVMGRGKAKSGGIAYAPKKRAGATGGTRHPGIKGGGDLMGYGPGGYM